MDQKFSNIKQTQVHSEKSINFKKKQNTANCLESIKFNIYYEYKKWEYNKYKTSTQNQKEIKKRIEEYIESITNDKNKEKAIDAKKILIFIYKNENKKKLAEFDKKIADSIKTEEFNIYCEYKKWESNQNYEPLKNQEEIKKRIEEYCKKKVSNINKIFDTEIQSTNKKYDSFLTEEIKKVKENNKIIDDKKIEAIHHEIENKRMASQEYFGNIFYRKISQIKNERDFLLLLHNDKEHKNRPSEFEKERKRINLENKCCIF